MMDLDLVDLLMAFRGSELPVDRCEELLARLRFDEPFRRSFVDEIKMLGMLKAVQSSEPRWIALQEELGWGGDERESFETFVETTMRGFTELPHAGGSERRFGARQASLVVALSLVGLVAIGLISWRPAAPPPADRTQAVATGTLLAMVAKLDGVRWESTPRLNPIEGSMLAAGRLSLLSGKAVLSFLNGVTLTLEGPSDVDLLTNSRVYCRHGKLRVRVPRGAEGFVVTSAGSALVDLGTEFAMNVESDGRSRVMVFEGAAEASLLDARGFARRTLRFERSKEYELDPNHDRIQETIPKPEAFVAAPDLRVAPLCLDSEYSSEVMALRPKCYWRFESLDNSLIPNEVAGEPPLLVRGPIRLFRNTGGNHCVVFPPGTPGQFLTTDQLWEITCAPSHAVELWAMTENVGQNVLIGLYPPSELVPPEHRYMHTELVEMTSYQPHKLDKPGSVRFLCRRLSGGRADYNLYSSKVYSPRVWHHIVAQREGEKLQLYFDGLHEESRMLEPHEKALPCCLVVGRRTTDPLDSVKDSRSFVGRIDELAIYDRALSAEEILRHFEMRRPSGAQP
jgi:ferric-dicitrate binding protein FerR (iron transport regulator)